MLIARAPNSVATRRIETASMPSASARPIAARTIASRVSVVRRRPTSRAHTGSRTSCCATGHIVHRSTNSLHRKACATVYEARYTVRRPGGTMTRFDPALRNMSVVVALGAIMTVLDTTIVNVAVHVLGRDLHTSLSTIQWVLTGYTLALSMTIPVTGWAVDRFGARPLWITSLA